jgi:hypothetical protein
MICTGHDRGIAVDLGFQVVRFQDFKASIGISRESYFFVLLITLPSGSVRTRSSDMSRARAAGFLRSSASFQEFSRAMTSAWADSVCAGRGIGAKSSNRHKSSVVAGFIKLSLPKDEIL